MAARWSVNTESGILRKNKPKENHEELLVFGYACKLFREDEKALYIDQGKHLIPWMGDENIKVDRYDCRGHLSDLKPYERNREGYDATRWLGLSDSERKLEQLCDDERYYSLRMNEEEEELYKEEEQKRLKTNEFQYNYDVPTNPELDQEGVPTAPEAEEEEELEEYVPPNELDVPVDIPIPKTVKENTRIEKTALFVSKQGQQMEILLKTKQGDNPQFSFLNQGDPLFKFYRHVLQAIKNGRYQVQALRKAEENAHEVSDPSGADDHYLHPSLVATTAQSEIQTSSITIPSVPYKPSANCAYSQLVNRIQGTGNISGDVLPPIPQGPPDIVPQPVQIQPEQVPQNFNQMTYEQQQQYYQYYYTAQYYEYYKQMAHYQQNTQPGDGQMPPPDIQDQNMQNYIQQMVYAQYMQQQQEHQQQQNNSYAQIVTNVNKDVSNPYSALLANLPQPQTQDNVEINKGSIPYLNTPPIQEQSHLVNVPNVEAPLKIECVDEKDNLHSKKPLLSLAQYGSGSDTEDSNSDNEDNKSGSTKENFSVPSGDAQIVIDKMAIYVSKNGIQFEEIVKAKGDPRFNFLYDNHEFYKYYRNKIAQLKGETAKPVVNIEEQTDTHKSKVEPKNKSPPQVKVKEKKVIAPVCFSIKKAKEDAPKEIKSALPMEESDDEDNPKTEQSEPTQMQVQGTSVTSNIPTAVIYSTPITVPVLMKPTTSTVQSTKSITSTEPNTDVNESKSSSPNVDSDSSKEPLSSLLTAVMKKNGVLDTDDPILEMIDLTDDLEDRKGAKRAADKIKDKLAAAAREKLASAARDKALQLERKKKLAAFLKLKSAETSQPDSALPINNKNSNCTNTNNSSRRSSVDSTAINPIKTPVSQIVLVEKEIDKQEYLQDKEKSRDKVSIKNHHHKKRERGKSRSRSREKDKKKEKLDAGSELEKSLKKYDIINLDDSESEDGELKKKKKSSKKKKSHKRKHSKSKHEPKSKKKSKKKRKRSDSSSSISS